ncbi:penicillin-binding protein 2 [Desulfosporosinus sp.]|uniref:penicillin-binding protein 2 n=1 Tax=Desulfosporosinus sp. TaxID=157907 RepID=UPI0025B95855|nr:penicillin-binding protein 2 [Desulfosporosinus sp.]MBC2721347.1 penicillin-binding protein 2 [Desulfosporosinus sp.]MBC2728799.1 penicillin-binding protein 2 [Desulfosporosinus sp.]
MDERERKPYTYRLWGLTTVVVLVFLILGFNLWRLQIAQGSYYSALAQGNVVKLVKVPPTRGDIVDRNGKLLVTSVPEFVLHLDWMDLQQSKGSEWKDVVLRLAEYVKPYWPNANQTVDSIGEDIFANIQNHQWERYRPVIILDEIPPSLQAVIAEHQEELPGVSVDAIPVRSYPEKTLIGQLLGYVREISDAEITQLNKNPDAQEAGFEYAQGDLVGKMGVEKSYDFWLRGKEGIQQVEVDNNARPVSKQIVQPAEAGKTVQLTIDANLQKTVDDTLDQVILDIQKKNPDAHAGAAVVMDVNTGKILAMTSRPAMDPNDLIGIISEEMADKYWPQDPKRASEAASLNRALTGVYPPGSVFKMVTAMAALQLGVTNPYEQIDDRLSSLGNLASQQQGIAEWGYNYFGHVNLYRALAKSSNIYFEIMGRRVFESNPEMIGQIAREFGLGVESGIDLPGEAKGIAPSAEWKKNYFGPTYEKSRDKKLEEIEKTYAPKLEQAPDAKAKEKLQAQKEAEIKQVGVWYRQMVSEYVDWKVYDSYNNSIGQGYNAYTPLQLANYVATMVNGGKHYRPYVVDKLLDPITGDTVKKYEPKVLNTVSVSPEVLDYVKQGMRTVTTGEGTANWLFSDVPEFSGGGKTGTAQIGSKDTSSGEIYNGVFVAFAPYDHPQIAFAGVVEFGGHGGETAGLVAKAAFKEYFGWKSTNEG